MCYRRPTQDVELSRHRRGYFRINSRCRVVRTVLAEERLRSETLLRSEVLQCAHEPYTLKSLRELTRYLNCTTGTEARPP